MGWSDWALNIFNKYSHPKPTIESIIPIGSSHHSVRHILKSIKTDDRQLQPRVIYLLAIRTIVPLSTQRIAMDLFIKSKDKLENLNWLCFIQPVVLCAIYYGLLRNVNSKRAYFYYTTDALLAFRYTHLISNISPPLRRGLVLLDFVNSILVGQFPSAALKNATSTFKIKDSLSFPIDKFSVEKDGKLTRKKINKKVFKNIQNVKPFKEVNKKSHQPFKKPCRNCNMWVMSNNFTQHNRVCPRAR